MIATTFALAAGPAPAGAAAVDQTVNCGLGGNQVLRVSGTAPATVPSGGTFTVELGFESGVADGSSISNMRWAFRAPAGSTVVPGSASVVGSGSTTGGSFGTTTAVISGSDIELRSTGTISNGATFTPPGLRFDLQATGVGGTVLPVRSRSTNAYTLSASGFNISCNTTGALANYTSTQIETAAPPTTQPGATTVPQQIVTTQEWTPGGGCGAVQTTTAPANAQSMTVNVAGAPGGRSGGQGGGATVAGGVGGQAVATFPVSPGDDVAAVVGCAGNNGGDFANTTPSAGYSPGGTTGRGSVIAGITGASGGTGGGSSAVCIGTVCKQDSPGVIPLVVAGAGGGGGVSNCAGTPSGPGGNGGAGSSTDLGAGGGPSGLNGSGGGNSGSSSGGGSGGAGGVNANGGIGTGGSSPNGSGGAGLNVVGGGGGGGYIGGAQGGNANTGCKGGGGGGGGSTWISTTASTPSTGTASSGAGVTVTFNIVTDAPPFEADIVPFLTTEDLVDQQFQDFLGRAPTTGERNAWIEAIDTGAATADELIVTLVGTNASNVDARLVRLYLAYFNRAPDPSGFEYWSGILETGRPLGSVSNFFARSGEFRATYGSLSDSAFVDLVYQNVLGRAPDASGRTYWLGELAAGRYTRGSMMTFFSDSAENRALKAPHVAVFRMHRAMLGSLPTTPAFFALVDPIVAGEGTLEDAAKSLRYLPAYADRVL